VPGSLTILTQRLGLFKYLVKETGEETAMALTPLGLLAGALLAAGLAAYVAYKYFHGLAEKARELNEALNGGAKSLERQDEEMRKASEAAQAYRDWLKKLEEGHFSLAEAVNEGVEAMREEFDLRQKLAHLQGQTAAQAQVEKEKEDAKELEVIARAREDAEKRLAKAKEESTKSDKEANDLKLRSENAIAATKATASIADKDKGLTASQIAMKVALGLINPATPGIEQAVEDAATFDPLKAHAASAYDEAQLAALSKQATDKAADDKKKAEQAQSDLDKLTKEQDDRQRKAGLNPLEEQIAALEDAKRGKGRGAGGDSLTRTGNFLGSSPGQINGGMSELIKLQRQAVHHLTEIQKNTAKRGPSGMRSQQ
jgi:myosin heavy subunit